MTAKMMTECFNLVQKPWLPVTLADGFPDRTERGPLPRVSLREAFEHGGQIQDLRCRPHERIALMRLLIRISQGALDGPEDEEDWRTCKPRLAAVAVGYLGRETESFNLLGESPRFLQATTRGKGTQFSTQKLLFVDEEGSTLFEAHVQPGCQISLPELAVGLLTFQSFAAGGRVEGASDSLPAGLCRESSALHSFLLGATLIESVWLNLVAKDRVTDNGSMVFGDVSWRSEKHADRAYLYRLAPTARHLWLNEGGATVEGSGGRKFLTFEKWKVRELTTAIRKTPSSSRRGSTEVEELASASAGGGVPKAVWRELHALAILRSAGMRGGPAVLEHYQTAKTAQRSGLLRLWCGALVGGGKNRAAAVGDTIESIFLLPVEMLEKADSTSLEDQRKCPGTNRTYRLGVGLAEHYAGRVQAGVKRYFECYDPRDPRKKHRDRTDSMKKLRQRKANAATTSFWTALEQKAEPVLLHDVAVNSAKYWSNDSHWLARSPWGREVIRAAKDAYDFSCPHATPRQIRAYAAGLVTLVRPDIVKSEAADRTEETEDTTET